MDLTAEDRLIDALFDTFDPAELSTLLDDARGLENTGRNPQAWEKIADCLWLAYSRRHGRSAT